MTTSPGPPVGPHGTLVEGDDLAVRLARGAIPLTELVPIARQIAQALEVAHEQGVIHQDLKPKNVTLLRDGVVHVRDFGLARVTAPSSPEMIERTVGYLSPEQARGKPVDRRADIWAFGVILYEMLTGQHLFKGNRPSEILASVLNNTVSSASLPEGTPPEIRWLISRCLDRELRTRLRDIGEARVILAGLESMGAIGAPVLAESSERAGPKPVPVWLWALPAVTLGAALIVFALRSPPAAPLSSPYKLLAKVGAEVSLPVELGASVALSPDGTTIAFVGQQSETTRLYIRALTELQAAGIGGTDGASSPFFSPDGRWIAFFAGGKLKKVSVTGGAPVTLCDAPAGRGGAWTDRDLITFMPTNTSSTRLMSVSASGGAASLFVNADGDSTMQRWPQALPDGRGLLYTGHSGSARFDAANLVIAPLQGSVPKVVVRGGYYGRYVSSGHLVYFQNGALFAVPFDLARLETTGPAVLVLEGVAADPATGGGQIDFSSDATLVYLPGAAAQAAHAIDWITPEGRNSPLRSARAEWANPRFSPDGRRLALNISNGRQHDIFIHDWLRDITTQLTFEAADDRSPVWSPDGRRIVFSSDRARSGVSNLYGMNADGSQEAVRLTDSATDHTAGSWHPDARILAFHGQQNGGSLDLMTLSLTDEFVSGAPLATLTPFLNSKANEMNPMFSPDGRWIAYSSDESGGNFEIYVRPYPGPGGQWRISTGGGNYPRWSARGDRLLFLSQGRILASSYSVAGQSFRAEPPRVWSPTRYRGMSSGYPYDVHPDGARAAAIALDESEPGSAIRNRAVFFFGFGEHLKKVAPPSR